MTGIIFRGLENNSFSLPKFYLARANRIIPALVAMCLALLIFGWFNLIPIDYRALGNEVVNAIIFVSNIIYSSKNGYFDATSHEKWLLHTWSLSVEWQFYIVYPILLLALKRFFSIETIKKLIIATTLIGFSYSVFATIYQPDSAYYLLASRAWEMLFGGIAYLYPWSFKESQKKLLELSGLALIFISYAFISSDTPWPGHFALLPVIGTYLVIVANRQNSLVTNNPIFQAMGKWSYSIYLWHWPLVVFGEWNKMDNFFIIGIAASIILGCISFKFIENKQSGLVKHIFIKDKYFRGAVTVLLLGGLVHHFDGVDIRYNESQQSLYSSIKKAKEDWAYPDANLDVNGLKIRRIQNHEQTDKNILFIGASHIEQTYPYVSALNNKYNVYYLTMGGCFVTPSMNSQKEEDGDCSNIKDYMSLMDKVNFDKVVTSFYCFDCFISKNKSVREEQVEKRIREYDEFLKDIKSRSKEVFLILGEPQGDEFSPVKTARHNLKPYVPLNKVVESYSLHNHALSELKELNDVNVINPLNYLCKDGVCPTRDGNNFFYRDSNHMRPWYAKEKLSYLSPILS